MSELVCIREFANRIEAQLAQSFLESAGINSVISADDSGGWDAMPIQFIGGGVKLFISKNELEEARKALSTFSKI